MMNHFTMFANEAAAISALSQYGRADDHGIWQWDQSRVIPGQRVVLARAVWDYSDPENPAQSSPEATVSGFFITVTLPQIDATLRDLPDHACRLIGDSETGALVYTAPDIDPGLFASAIIEPMPAGAAYTFGSQ